MKIRHKDTGQTTYVQFEGINGSWYLECSIFLDGHEVDVIALSKQTDYSILY